MRRLVLALLFVTSMAGSARADCGPYVDLFEREDVQMFSRGMFDPTPKLSMRARAGFANLVGNILLMTYMGAEDRGLQEMQECTQALYGGFYDNLGGGTKIALAAGWAGWLNPEISVLERGITNREWVQRLANEILADAERIAAVTGLLPPLLDEDTPPTDTDIVGEWRGVELTIIIQGKSQVKPMESISASFDADGTFRMMLTDSESDSGRWDFDGSVLSILGVSDSTRKYNVSLQDDMMQWEITKHDGQWSEKWVWQR